MPTMLPTAPRHADQTDDKKPRGLRETIIVTTPVALTLLATALAGISSSEMTRAQYYRAVAAQNQAKVSDQWNFFQFKRTRRMIAEKTLDLERGGTGPVEPEHLDALCRRMGQLCGRVRDMAARLAVAVAALPAGNEFDVDGLKRAANRLKNTTQQTTTALDKMAGDVHRELARPEVREDMAYLGSDRLPTATEQPVEDEDINAVLEKLRVGAAESEVAASLVHVPEKRILDATAVIEANARAFESAGKQSDRRMRSLDTLLAAGRQKVQAVHRAAGAVDDLLADAPADNKTLAPIRQAAAELQRTEQTLWRTTAGLNDYRASREDYNARRNDREAVNNQKVAQVYELEVRKNSVTAERHRTRSARFFYGMLCAQAGTTLASLALAARQRSLLWSLAGVAGLIAVAFSTYVYLCM